VFPVLVFVVAQSAVAGSSGAWSSARPPECAPLDVGRLTNVWERAKAPKLRRYCDLLASGASKLAGGPGMREEVLGIADHAEQTYPGHAAPMALKGRALCELGRYAEALAALREAKAREKDDRALDDPLALYAWARSLARGTPPDLAGAVAAYGALLPRAATLSLADRSAASLEAGLLTMNEGPPGLDSAVPILREAIRDAQDTAQVVSVLALALALDRAGEKDEARALLQERLHGDPRPVLATAHAKEMLAPSLASEAHALSALALEAEGTLPAARAEWQAYLDASPSGPWADHARAHLTGKR
jgi:tetratricopeptide (TPR) repeat protein